MKLLSQSFLVLLFGTLAGVFCFVCFSAAQESNPGLPQPCSAMVTCGSDGISVFVTEENAASYSYGADGQTLTVRQELDRVFLNWQSFNIAEGNRVRFEQPRDISVALNRIFDQNPSEILGAIDANGQVYLLNPNGFVFGESSTVNTQTLLASALNISEEVFNETGLTGALDIANVATLEAFEDTNGSIDIAAGARITTSEGGRILLFAPQVVNAGTLTTPGGQTLLAGADDKVYLEFSDSDGLRGLTVELEGEGSVRNLGEITAERGNITLAAVLLEQQGVLRSTTSVDENGSIDLQAKTGTRIVQKVGDRVAESRSGGELIVGADSVTEVLPDSSTATAIDAQEQEASRISLLGRTIEIGERARLTATGGNIDVLASLTPAQDLAGRAANSSSLSVAGNAVLDVSGTRTTVLPMSRNQVDVELRGNEFADAPLQRDGVVRGETVSVDRRRGTPFGDIQEVIETVPRTIEERLSVGGEISLRSEGSIDVAEGATLNVQGGAVRFEDGFVQTTRLVNGTQVVDIADADPSVVYNDVLRGSSKDHDTWGVTEVFDDPTGMRGAAFEAGYLEGKDAGRLGLVGAEVSFAGTLLGGTVRGRHQRLPGAAASDLFGGSVTRPFDQIPLGAELVIDVQNDVGIVAQRLAFTGALLLEASTLEASGVQSLTVDTLGSFALAADVALELVGGFELDVVAGEVRFDGSLSSSSGRVELLADDDFGESGALTFGAGSRIDVSGRWVNDFEFRNLVPNDPVWIEGGSVTAEAEGSLLTATGASVSADGGAWLRADESLIAGAGGDLAFIAVGDQDTQFLPPIELRAFGLTQGGTLRLEANSIALRQQDQPPRPSIIVDRTPDRPDDADQQPAPLPFSDLEFVPKVDVWVPSRLLRDNGFENIELAGNRYGVVVPDGQGITPRLLNWVLRDNAETVASAQSLRSAESAATITRLPDFERRAANLTLSYSSPDAIGSADALGRSGVVIGRGASISVDTGGDLSLSSTGSIWVDGGRLIAPAGHIRLAIENFGRSERFLQAQSIRVDAGSEFSVAGTLIELPNQLNLRRGNLLPGGQIDIDAQRGFVVIEGEVRNELGTRVATAPLFDVSGAAAELDIATSVVDRFEPTIVTSSGGDIHITAAEGGVVQGAFVGWNERSASRDTTAAGGLEVKLDPNRRLFSVEGAIPQDQRFNTNARQLVVTAVDGDPGFAFGDTVPEEYRNRLLVDVVNDSVQTYDRLSLHALATIRDLSGSPPSAAEILFAEDTSIRLRESVSLFAPIIGTNGSNVALSAAYVSLGDDAVNRGVARSGSSVGSAGDGRLLAQAEHIDLHGDAVLNGFSVVDLSSQGDIRLRGVAPDTSIDTRALEGRLETAGDLRLQAQRLFPTTLTDFTLEVGQDFSFVGAASSNDGDADVNSVDASPLQSFGGRLRVRSDAIDIDSQLLVPGGGLVLDGIDSVTLGDAAVVSTRLQDDLVLFGQLQAGLDWVYRYPSGPLVFDALPESQIDIRSDSISTAAGSLIETSGGGDLLGYEFIAGPGGSEDFLAADVSPNSFAILPGAGLRAAPADPQESRQFDLRVGSSVYIDPVAGLPGGEHILLPARYALLPGAFLVTPVDTLDLVPGEVRRDSDGVTVIGARFGNAGSGLADSRVRGVRIQSGQVAAALNAEYELTSANAFYQGRDSRRPDDGANVSLSVAGSIDLEGAMRTLGALGGADGRLSLQAERLAILAPEAEAAPTGFARLNADVLSSFDVGGLYLGAGIEERRSAEGLLRELVVTTSDIVVGEGVELAAREIVLAATDSIQVGADQEADGELAGVSTVLRSVDAGGNEEPVAVSSPAGAALLAVSRDRIALENLGTGDEGATIGVGSGALLSGQGSLVVAAPGGATLDGRLAADGADATLAAARLVLVDQALLDDQAMLPPGDDAPNSDLVSPGAAIQRAQAQQSPLDLVNVGLPGDLVLSSDQLAGLLAGSLALGAATEIVVEGAISLSTDALDRLELAAPLIRAGEAEGSSLVGAAQNILFSGQAPVALAERDSTGSTFELTASNSIEFETGAMALDGFADVLLVAAAETRMLGDATLTASGDLEIQTPYLEAGTLTSSQVRAAGDLVLSGGSLVSDVETVELGGAIDLTAESVIIDTAVLARSGLLRAEALSGALQIASNARLDVSGASVAGQLASIETDAGRISLLSAADLRVDEGAVVQLSASQERRAGDLQLAAANQLSYGGTLDAAGNEGSLHVVAGTVDPLSDLLALATDGGVGGAVSLRVGSGDLRLTATPALQLDRFTVVADSGFASVDGDLRLNDDGRFRLAGGAGVAFGAAVTGERLRLELEALGDEAELRVRPTTLLGSGELTSRVLRNDTTAERVEIATVAADYAQTLELVSRVAVDDVLTQTELERGELALASASAAGPGVELPAEFSIAYGLWFDAADDLAIDTEIDLADWRTGDLPGRLLVTAGGDLNVRTSINDGLRKEGDSGIRIDRLQTDDSWGIALVAGRDANSADSLAVADGAGDLVIADNVYVRTGTGHIDLRAADNFVLEGSGSAVYTVGVATPVEFVSDVARFSLLRDAEFPERGGNVSIVAGRDIVAAPSEQFLTDYVFRSGDEGERQSQEIDDELRTVSTSPLPTLSGISFNQLVPVPPSGEVVPSFRSGIGSLGTGNIEIDAVGSIVDLSVVAPELIEHAGDAFFSSNGEVVFSDNSVTRRGSSQVRITSGGDLLGGVVHVGAGRGAIRSAGSVLPGTEGLGLLLALGDAQVDVSALRDLRVDAAVDPQIMLQSLGRFPALQERSQETYFFSFTDQTALSVRSVGDLVVGSDSVELAANLPRVGQAQRDEAGLNVWPGDVRVEASAGNVTVGGDLLLFPDPDGGLELVSANSISTVGGVGANILISDASRANLPRLQRAADNLGQLEVSFRTGQSADAAEVHARTPVHLNDPNPSILEAITGAIDAPLLALTSGEALQTRAAEGVNLLAYRAQNTKASDVSLLQSGGDVRLEAIRNPIDGTRGISSNVIEVAGPGKLEVIAGRSVELGTSSGIQTIGNLENPSLADRGADVVVLTGAGGEIALDSLFVSVVAENESGRQTFGDARGVDLPDSASAQEYFESLSESERREIAFELLFQELEAAGLAASELIAQSAPAADIELAYERGQRAVELLFPSGSDLGGDLSLLFSQIQTQGGGDISLLVPGGLVNVGLSVASGASKDPFDLGIVAAGEGDIRIFADGNIEVNRSRIFSLNGGDISIWSANGDVDAGRGAKSVLATPALAAVPGENDTLVKVVPPAISGSGIAADSGRSGRLPDILLSTPNGIVDAGDAGIRTPGRLFTAAVDVVGRDNIDAGSFVGAPADTVVLSADVAAVGDSAASATQDLATAGTAQGEQNQAVESQADAALGWLEVLLEGFGPEYCDPAEGDDCDPNA